MIRLHFTEMAKLIGPLYKGSAVAEVVKQLVDPHQYVAFYRKEELENIIRMTCFNKGWNEEFTVAVHGDVDLTTSSGFKFGSCLLVPDTTPEQLAMLIERGLRMKAFL
jgi:hypothetical protein